MTDQIKRMRAAEGPFTSDMFKADDMGSPGFLELENANRAAAIANQRFHALIKEYGVEVFGEISDKNSVWSQTIDRDEGGVPLDTHKAVIIMVEPL